MTFLADADTDLAPKEQARKAPFVFRQPARSDGPGVHALVGRCAPLDENSRYCNLLQCTHFSSTCIIAERKGRIAGWASGYILPDDPDHLFIWQVAVDPSARGTGLGNQMILKLLDRRVCEDVTHLVTSITAENTASWRLFRRVASALNATLEERPWFRSKPHLDGLHPTEHLVVIGPFSPSGDR